LRAAERRRRRDLRRFGAAQLALLVPLLALERRMQRTGGPGIIPFELAGTPDRARRIMDAWGADGRAAARASLVLDYPFLVAYTGFNRAVAGAAGAALDRRGLTGLARAAPAVGAAQVAAGAFDAAENGALLGVLAGGPARLPAVARACATAKFALLTAGWTYVAGALAARLARR
jgi:hypothetical protein